jgi:hypothetical protein
MSSWSGGGGAPRPPPRLGYFQALPEGTFDSADSTPVTVVTAYYEMKSKYPPAKYREWVATFLATLTCPIVFFTDAATLPFLEACPRASSSVEFIVLARAEWKANDPAHFPAGFWEAQLALDPERAIHSAELYKVWYEKKELVLRAIARNPFGSTKFVWTDAGIMRNAAFADLLGTHYPVAARIPSDRMMLLNYWPFTRSDEQVHVVRGVSIKGGGIDKPRIGGGVLAATAAVWQRWSELYDDAVGRYRQAGLFIGKDQTIFMTLVLEHKEFHSLLDLKKIAPEPWFYLLLYLGVSDRVWKILRSPRADREKWTYERFVQESSSTG